MLQSLNALRDERNRSAHGDIPQSLPECALRAAEAGHQLEAAVTEAAFLTDFPWLLIRSTNYRPGRRTFEVTASLTMGGHPDFDLRRFVLTQPVGTDLFYLLDHGAPILLSPFVTSRFCPTCRNLEVCYPVHADSGTGPATMRSFERGHDIEDLQLGDEIRNLTDSR
ncbi:hypothetical protein KGA66_03310 [Actinocrinis puniceicyclus]|uniref:Uncharacterized protein n=1 Tax=Actinocrinis puniceicyclus TaxID=977794 RepID=A0A8J8B9P7_9ACTN|nr:hypothetical protein [Actinocrinis puniceicyclus]MBS2962062.1 hypothetical protein [Actinocrinis puniceicyclus]